MTDKILSGLALACAAMACIFSAKGLDHPSVVAWVLASTLNLIDAAYLREKCKKGNISL
jgi:hypothetical protein